MWCTGICLPVPRTVTELWTFAARIFPSPSFPSPFPLLSLVFLLRVNASSRNFDPSPTGVNSNIRFRPWGPNSVQQDQWWGWTPLADAVVPSRFVLGLAPRQQQGNLVLVCTGQVIAMPGICVVFCVLLYVRFI
jgi:hypothetical protein